MGDSLPSLDNLLIKDVTILVSPLLLPNQLNSPGINCPHVLFPKQHYF